MPKTKRRQRGAMRPRLTASDGIYVKSKLFKDYMACLALCGRRPCISAAAARCIYAPANCPRGVIIVAISKHYTAVIDGVIHDMHDPSRGGTRCVYGYWRKV